MGGAFGKIGSAIATPFKNSNSGVEIDPAGPVPPVGRAAIVNPPSTPYKSTASDITKSAIMGALKNQPMQPRRGGQPTQFQIPSSALPPEFYQPHPILPPQQINPNLFYGG